MKDTESAPGKSGVLGTCVLSQEKLEKSDAYYSKLKGLNESVSKWIKQHVDANPFINLQPIFRDYERYFKELESGKTAVEIKTTETKKKEEAVSSMSNFVFKAVETVPDSTTGKLQEEKKSSSLNSTPQFSFGSSLASTTTSKPSFGFSSSPATSTFAFGKWIYNKAQYFSRFFCCRNIQLHI